MTGSMHGVLHVVEAAGGGTGRHVVDLVATQVEQGQNVCVVVASKRADPEILAGLKASVGENRVLWLELSRTPSFSDLRVVRTVVEWAKAQGNIGVVHGHSTKGGFLAGILRHVLVGVKSVYTPHAFRSLDPSGGRVLQELWSWVERWAIVALNDRVIVVSSAERRHALNMGVPAEKVTLVRNGLRPMGWVDRGRALNACQVDGQRHVVGFLSRMAPQKRPLTFLQVARELSARGWEIDMPMIGDGPLRGAVEAGMRQHRLEGMVKVIEPHNAVEVLPAFDVLLCTSAYEGNPYIFCEAASLGLCIVAPPVGGTEDVRNLGGRIEIAPSWEAGALADAVENALRWKPGRENPECEAGSSPIGLVPTLEEMANATLGVYRSVAQ